MTTKSLTDCYGRRLTVENGRPGIHLHASETVGPFTSEQLRAVLNEVAPAGSYTRTDEDTPEQYREAWQAAEKAVLDERAIRKEAEQERDAAQAEAAMCQTSLVGQIRRAEMAEGALVEMTAHRDQCRDTAIKWQMEANLVRAERIEARQSLADLRRRYSEQGDALVASYAQPRALTADDITNEMVCRAQMEWERRNGAAPIGDTIREILTAALTPPPPRPEGAEDLDPIVDEFLTSYWRGDIDGAGATDWLAERGVRVASVGLTPTNPKTED